MKRIICAVFTAGAIATLLTGSIRAEGGDMHRDHRGEFSERMKLRLGLSDDQDVKVKAAFEAQKTAGKPLREQLREQSNKLESQVRDLAPEKDIAATLDSLESARKSMAAERQKLEASLASILKPSQRAKMHLWMMAHRKGNFDGGHESRKCGRSDD